MMTTEQSRRLIQEYIKAINTLDQYIADPVLKGHIIIFETGLPNYQFIANDIIAEGNKVVVRATIEGRHTGELFGVAPSGQQVKVEGIIIYEVADEKIVNHWTQADTVALMQQIGAMPVAANGH